MNDTQATTATAVTRHGLRELVAQRLGGRYERWAKEHPNLAAAIDRTVLVESTVALLRNDESFQRAMREADVDEAKLALAAGLIERIDRWVTAALPL